MKQGNIGVTTENIFPVIKKFLYSDHEIFIREIVSNAVDATQKLKTLAGKGDFKGEMGDLKIRVSVDKDAKTITVSDNGIGMTADEIEKYINQIAFSGANDFLDKYKDEANAIIGHFGLGFYSSFMVSKQVDIITKSYQDAPAVKWSCDGSPSFTLEVSSEARELLGKKGYDIQFGARPLKRAIQDLLEDPLCELLMEQGEQAMLFKAEVNTENKDKINITYETR